MAKTSTSTKRRSTKKKGGTSRRKPASRRNVRRDEPAPFRRFKYAFLLLILVGVAALTHTVLTGRIKEVGDRIKKLEVKIDTAEKELQAAVVRWQGTHGHQNIEQALRRHQLRMAWPEEDQVIEIRRHGEWVRAHRAAAKAAFQSTPQTAGLPAPDPIDPPPSTRERTWISIPQGGTR